MYGLRSRPYRLTVRTAPFHGVNRGSIPRGVTTIGISQTYTTRVLIDYLRDVVAVV